jgi:hypothetical protein
VARLNYLSGKFYHDEAYVFTRVDIDVDSSPYVGYWASIEALKKDHEGYEPPKFRTEWKPFEIE